MTNNECQQIKEKVNKLIAFLLWKGAPFESKKRKVVKELCLIKDYYYARVEESDVSSEDMPETLRD
ncbi:MAG TPA: hypothetical protein VEF53_06770 [Patescibacteria group bacterium]|nr:hypothetical protein [Patescibacteria group bacterium]